MVKLEVINKNEQVYELKEGEIVHTIVIEFLDVDVDVKVGDYICMSAELLNPRYEGYSSSYVFGILENMYGKLSISINDLDVIKLVTKEEDKEIYLKRLYG